MFEPHCFATASTSWSTSSNALLNSPEDCGLNAIAAPPAVLSPSDVSSVTAAVVSAKSRSSFGSDSLLLPKRTSRSPKTLGDGAAHLAGDLRELGESLLGRGGVHEEAAQRPGETRGGDEENR